MATAIGIGQLTLASSRGSSISTTVHRHRVSRTSNRPRGDQSSVPDYYCVGPSMAADWGDDGPPLSRALVQRVFCYFVPYWRRALIVLGCIGISAGLGLAPALVTKGVIDYLGNPTNGVGPLALLVAGGVAASLGQSVGFFTSRRSGDLLSRMSNDVGGIQDVVSETVFGLVSDVITVPTTLALMLALDWRLTLAALVLMPIVLLPTRYVGKATYRIRKQTQEKLSQMSSYMQEVLGISGILLVNAFTKERAKRHRFGGINPELRRLEIRETMIGRWFGLLN